MPKSPELNRSERTPFSASWKRQFITGANALQAQLKAEGAIVGARLFIREEVAIYVVKKVEGGRITIENEVTKEKRTVGAGMLQRDETGALKMASSD